jgi:hypothetical protein
MDDDGTYIWITNQLWTSDGIFRDVKWYNPALGGVQFWAVPGLETMTNLGFRWNNQYATQPGIATVPHGVETTSLAQYLMYYTGTDEYYTATD